MEYSFGKPIGIQSLPRVTTIWITHNPDLFVNFNTLLHRFWSVVRIAENFLGVTPTSFEPLHQTSISMHKGGGP